MAQLRAVLFDLDGTLLDTERLIDEVVTAVVAELGGVYPPSLAASTRGLRPLDACAAVCTALSLPLSPAELYARTDALLGQRWSEAAVMPGAERLLRHLHAAGTPVALVTSSSRSVLAAKLAALGELAALLAPRIVCGDDVQRGKPDPEPFLAGARLLDVDPQACLAVEDALPGVASARAAGCHVLAVPSVALALHPQYAGERTRVLRSLLDVDLGVFGLPPLLDWVERTLPLPPLRLKGPVIRGFGRGSRLLGIPTANLDVDSLGHSVASSACTGIYAAFASVGASPAVYDTVLSIGWNPFFKDVQRKTVEPWLLHHFAQDFYGQELRLSLVAYIRPEADFTSLDALVAQIHDDAAVARAALQLPRYAPLRSDPFLVAV